MQWLSAFDIFVLPSRTEAFSNALMEAMACGCCVIASDVGGNPELVRDKETGLLFPPGDTGALTGALLQVIDNPELRLRLANDGERSVRDNFPSNGLLSTCRKSIQIFSPRPSGLTARLRTRPRDNVSKLTSVRGEIKFFHRSLSSIGR